VDIDNARVAEPTTDISTLRRYCDLEVRDEA